MAKLAMVATADIHNGGMAAVSAVGGGGGGGEEEGVMN